MKPHHDAVHAHPGIQLRLGHFNRWFNRQFERTAGRLRQPVARALRRPAATTLAALAGCAAVFAVSLSALSAPRRRLSSRAPMPASS